MSKNWAICIGINEYYNLTPLRYAVQDAVAVRDFFLTEVEFEEVFYFADDSPPIATPDGPIRSLPTYANLTYFFRKRFQQQFLSVGDNFWFFFAGHGELHEGHDYLMPIDVDPENLERTALRISDITASLRNSGADNTVLLLDACRSEGKRSAVGFGGEAQPGIVTVYSCSPRQASYEIEALGHGAFTHALLEGLRLQGANSCATVQRIDQYLCHQVPSLNQRYQKPVQTPYTAVEPLSKNCLILLPQRARLEDVQALKLAAYQAESENNWDFAQQLWTRVLATPGVDSDAVNAIGRIALNRAKYPSSVGDASVTTAGSRRIEVPVEPKPPEPKPSKPTFSFKKVVCVDAHTHLFDVVRVDAQGNTSQRERRITESHREALGQGVDLYLMAIPGGSFQMGSSVGLGDGKERPQHKVAVKPFLMGLHQVTQAQWRVVAAFTKVEQDLKAAPSYFKGDSLPVEYVDWDDATEFCQRLSRHSGRAYRLPSEAEWEYACRAGATTAFHFGDTLTSELANYDATVAYGSGPKGEYREKTTAVGSFPANAFGLYDMHGNVWEWCQDHWHENYQGAPEDGSAWLIGGDTSRRLLRGGSWDKVPAVCRSANRVRNARVNRCIDVGFRVVCASS